jgi:hypothetical protein
VGVTEPEVVDMMCECSANSGKAIVAVGGESGELREVTNEEGEEEDELGDVSAVMKEEESDNDSTGETPAIANSANGRSIFCDAC